MPHLPHTPQGAHRGGGAHKQQTGGHVASWPSQGAYNRNNRRRTMDQHAKMTFHIGQLYSGWAEEVCRFFSHPVTFDEDGNLTPEQPEQPSDEEKAQHLRDAEAHARMAEFDAAMVAVAGKDAAIPRFPVS